MHDGFFHGFYIDSDGDLMAVVEGVGGEIYRVLINAGNMWFTDRDDVPDQDAPNA